MTSLTLQETSTTFILSNLHCPSCVSQIEQELSGLGVKPSSVSCSILAQIVVVRHPTSLTARRISDTLEDAGFDFYAENDHQRVDQAFHSWHPLSSSTKRKRHLDACEYCQANVKLPRLSTSTNVPRAASASRFEKEPLVNSDIQEKLEPIHVIIGDADPPRFKATIAISGMTCSSCSGSITRALEAEAWVRTVDVNLLTHFATIVFQGMDNKAKIVEIIEDVGFEASIEELLPSGNDRRAASELWRVTYAIGGMTCSSCVNSLTSALKLPMWVSAVDVNLITHTADLVIDGKMHAQDVVSIVAEIGFEAELVKLDPHERGEARPATRTVSIRVDGMFCSQCPLRIKDALLELQGVQIEGVPTVDHPVVVVVYYPSPPVFTVRTVLDTITALDKGFKATIHKPPTLEDRQHRMQSQQRHQMAYRVAIALLAAIPTFIIGIVYMTLVPSSNKSRMYLMNPLAGIRRGDWAMFVLATVVYFFGADIFHRRTLKELHALWRPGSRTPIFRRFYRFGSMNMLMSFGTSIAYWSSIAEMGISASQRGQSMSDASSNPSYFDSVVFLTLFLLIGRLIEAYSKAKTGDAISALAILRPRTAMLMMSPKKDEGNSSESAIEVDVDLIESGDIVRIMHGASPPFDGTLLQGETHFDESSLTGESRLVYKSRDSEVFAGTINKGDAVSIRVTGSSGTSMLDQIMNVVREGQTKRAPVERIADLLTGVFVPVITLLAILTWLIWLTLGLSGALPKQYLDVEVGGWPFWSLQFAIAVFVVACPCGLGLAAPTALFVGGGLAAKKGILVRGGGEAFQEASGLDIVAFDKTGTLTQGGLPQITDFAFLEPASITSKAALAIVRQLESDSTHPIAKALVDYSRTVKEFALTTISAREVPGKGMRGSFVVEGDSIEALIGNESLMSDFSVEITAEQVATLDSWKAQGRSVALLATKTSTPAEETSPSNDDKWLLTAIFAISDPLRPEAAAVVAALHHRNIAVWMISGDNPATARAIGSQLNIPYDNIIAGVLPAAKADSIKYLQRSQSKRPSTSSRLGSAWRHVRRRLSLPLRSASTKHHDATAASVQTKRATVAFVGDGINDAPALTAADVSIAIGSGSDVALNSASFILLHSDLRALLTLLDLSRTVFRRVAFNFAWALVYNVVLVPVAAGCFYGIRTGGSGDGMEKKYKGVRLDPAWAALAMAASSISVVVSSLALRWSWLPGVGFRDRSGGGLSDGSM